MAEQGVLTLAPAEGKPRRSKGHSLQAMLKNKELQDKAKHTLAKVREIGKKRKRALRIMGMGAALGYFEDVIPNVPLLGPAGAVAVAGHVAATMVGGKAGELLEDAGTAAGTVFLYEAAKTYKQSQKAGKSGSGLSGDLESDD